MVATWTTCAAIASASITPLRAQCVARAGYPLSVSAMEPVALDTAYLGALSRSFAYGWQVPSNRRSEFPLWRRIRNRTLPPEPRWADDWVVDTAHKAQLRLTIFRNGRLHAAEPQPVSGNRLFDRSLRTIATEPIPRGPDLPGFPAEVSADSLVVLVTFGSIDVTGPVGITRFAAFQNPVALVPGSLEVTAPRSASTPPAIERRAVVKYDVTEAGNIAPSSFEILESSDREISSAIRDGLLRARFKPAVSNCRAITMTVLQRFGY